MSQINTSKEEILEQNSINELIKPYLKKWKWFALFVLIMVGLAILYLKKTSPTYQMTSTVLIRDVKKSALDFGMMSELTSFGGRSTSSINNEMELMKSKRLVKEVVENLAIQTKIFSKKGLRKDELYGDDAPFKIKVLTQKKIDPAEKILPLQVSLSGEKIILSADNIKTISTQYGKTVNLPYANIMFIHNRGFAESKLENLGNISVEYSTVDNAVSNLQKSLDISLVDRDATVIGITIKQENREKGKNIVNTLVEVYNLDAINDKNSESKKTKEFIDERLAIITDELGRVEDQKERFKNANQITDIPTETQLNLTNAAATRARLLETDTQIEISNDLIGYLSKQGTNQVLPSTVGLNNPSASSNITIYNQLVLERNKLLENATPQNPAIVDLTKQIANLRAAVMDNLIKNRASLNETRQQMLSEQNMLSSKIRKVPAWEKMFRNIERQQSIKENLYLILLQKREETAIVLANTIPKAKILDEAYASEKPVSPKKVSTLGIALVIGLLIPGLLVYLLEVLNNKLRSRHDLEILSGGSIIGELPSLGKADSELVNLNDLSPVAESFRILATNLNFLLPKKDKGKIVFVTSTVKGEGKTFTSVNLALTLANKGTKVIIIGADIRNPQLQRYNPEKKGIEGLTEYLYDSGRQAADIIHTSTFNLHCDMIYSGSIPPNPTELLSNGRINELLDELKPMYDYIIVDTAPLMLVTDTFLFSEMADATIYVTRSKYTEKSLIGFANKAINEKKIRNVAFVINDVKKEFFSYGNKYGYGYNVTPPKKWWEFYKF